MTGAELFALLPLITLTTIILVLLMQVAFWRNHLTTCVIAAAGCLLTLVSTKFVSSLLPIQVTPLLIIDQYAMMFTQLIALTTFAVILLAYDYLKQRPGKNEEFYLLLLLASLGAIVLVCSNHFASLLLGLELLGVSLYALISYPVTGLSSLEAALKYLILSGISSIFILFGAAFIYAGLGSLSFPELGAQFASADGSAGLYVTIGSSLMLAGICFKLSLVPFHMWTPDVYEGAPVPVTAFIATVSKGAIFAILLRFFVLTDAYAHQSILIGLSVVAIGSMLVGNLLALMQTNIKRILAYSSIAHLGYLLVAFIAGGVKGGQALAIEASTYFLIAYFITTLGAFAVVSILSEHEELTDISDYEGLFWRRPILAGAFTTMLLSLGGIPLTIGFIGKFYIFAAGIQGALWLLVGVLVVGSGIGLYYYLRIVFAMTKEPSDSSPIRIPLAGGWVLVGLTSSLLFFGIYPTPVINLITSVVKSLT